MHENLAYFVIVRSGVGIEGNAFVRGDGTQLPSDARVHGAIVYGRQRKDCPGWRGAGPIGDGPRRIADKRISRKLPLISPHPYALWCDNHHSFGLVVAAGPYTLLLV